MKKTEYELFLIDINKIIINVNINSNVSLP